MRISSLVAATALLVSVTETGFAQTVDELVAKNLNAKGGVEKLRTVKARRITGKISPAPDVEIPVLIASKRPNKVRQESNFQGQQMITAFDGVKAWTVNPMMGITTPTVLEGAQFDMIRDQSDIDGPFVDYKAKGVTIELLGTESVEGQATHKLKVTLKSGQSHLLFLSAETGLEVKAVNEVQQGGATMTIESLFSNYKAVEGITLAHTITQKITGPQNVQLSITVEKVELLPDIDDALFVMPAVKP